jgi:HEPN domain-containing protein
LFSHHQRRLADIVIKVAAPDTVFLLGGSDVRLRTESIFNRETPSSQHVSGCFLLVLISGTGKRDLGQWQELIEIRCSELMPVTAIVLETSTFLQWLAEGHPLPCTVLTSAVRLYDSGNISWEDVEVKKVPDAPKELKKEFDEGLARAREFLAGSELYRVRAQHGISAFMLNQAAEQALRALLKLGTGYHANTHSIDRLLRYCSLVSPQLPDIFPKNNEREKQLPQLLQKAYIDTRYKEGYKINMEDLECLTERVSRLLGTAGDTGTVILQKIPHHEKCTD